jgi:tRNA (cmo5U34)-methyltransferase
MSTDRLYQQPHEQIRNFAFTAQVAEVFADMVQRSVPGYGLMLELLPVLSARHMSASSVCYDLGCSLGAASLAVQQGIRAPGCRIIAVDNSDAMLARARELTAGMQGPAAMTWQSADVAQMDFEPCALVVMNLTLQFIPREQRMALLQRIHEALVPGGALILSEKLRFADPLQQQVLTELHHDFKRAQGYSDLEIAQKRAAIEQVLLPDTPEFHMERLRTLGFSVLPWFQCLNFASFLALKGAM